MRCEELERRTLLTAIPASVETATLDVLAALRDDVRSAISNHVILQTQLPVIGASIADDLDIETMLSDGLYDPVNTYFGGAATDTGLAAALEAISVTSGDITVNVNSAAVTIDNSDVSNPLLLINFTLVGTQETEETASYPAGTISIDDSTVTVLHTLNLPVSIQIPFTSGAIADEDVYANLQAAEITSSVTAYTGASGNIGLLDVTFSPANLSLAVDLDISFNDVDGAGNLTLDQLIEGNLADDMTITPVASSLNLNLGVAASLCGTMLGASPQLSLSTTNVFSGTALSWVLNSDLSPVSIFQNMSVADVKGLFEQIATTLSGVSDTLNLDNVPWVQEAISDIIDVGATITQYTDQLQDLSGYTFDSFQELVDRLAAYISIPVVDLNLRCDAASHSVLMDVDITKSFSQAVLLDMSEDAGPLSIYAGVEAEFSANVHIEATIGFDLDALGGGEALSDRVFLTEGSSVSVSAEIDVPDIDLGVSIGPVGVCITDGHVNFTIGTSITLVDPGVNAADARVDLGEMIGTPVGDFLTIDSPTVTVSGELPLDGCTAAMNTLLDIDTTSSATRPALTLGLGTANDITTFTVTPDAEFNALIDGLTDFSDVSVWDAVQKVVLFLQNSNIEAFNVKLPLINKSINELIDAADNFLTMTGGLNTNFGTLKTSIQAQLASLDAAISAAASELAANIPDADDLNIAQTRLFDLRDAIDSALARVDLSTLPVRMMSIVGGLQSFITDYAADFTETALNTAVTTITGLIPSLNSLETRLESMLGLAPGDLAITMEDVGGDHAVVIRLNLAYGYHSTVPLDFSIEGSVIPVELDGAGDLAVDADFNLELDFGFNLATLSPFLLDTSSISGDASVSTTTLSVGVSIGGIVGVTLGVDGPGTYGMAFLKKNGKTTFTGDNSTTNFAVALSSDQSKVALVKVNGTVLEEGDDYTLTTTQLTFTTAPGSGASIEVLYPKTDPAHIGVTLVDNSGSPSDHVINFADINLSTFDFDIDAQIASRITVTLPFGGDIGSARFFLDLSDFDSLYASLPSDIESALEGEECDFSLWVSAFGTFLDTLEAGLESDILQKLPIIGGGLDVAGGFIGQLRSIVGTVEAILGGGLQSAIQNFFYTNLGSILVDGAGDPVDDPSDIDVTVGGATCVEINLHLHGEDTYSADFNVGLDAFILDIATSGGVDITVDYDIQLGIGFSLSQGFYIISNADPNDPEVELGLSADLALGSNLTASLFFINFKAEEVHDPGTILTGSLDLDLIDPSGSDGHISIDDIVSTPFTDLLDVSLSGNATVDLLLTADIASNPDLPYISAVLSVDWDFLGNDGLTGELPSVSLNDVSFHFGDFLSNIIGPVVDQLDDWIEPIKPVLDFLNTEIPVISDIAEFLGQPPVTVISLITGAMGEGGPSVQELFDILNAIVGIVTATSSFGNDVSINFGDFTFSQDLRTPGAVDADTAGTLDETGAGTAQDQLDSQRGTGGLGGILDSLADIGLDIPLITHPINIIKLLFGQRVDLIVWDIPRLEAGFDFEASFGPLLPPIPLYARIFGSLSVFADFSVGFDTRGFEEGMSIFDGFYFGDFDGSGNEMPELGLTATIGAGAELNVVIAKAGVEGGITATIGADWNDIDDDGKVYFDELGIQLGRGLKCVFDLTGTLEAFLNFYAALGLSTPFGDITLWEKTINLVNITLFDFTCTCPPLPPPVLAHVSDGSDGFTAGTLVGHVGPFASLRQSGATDGKDKLTVTQAIDETSGLPIPGSYLVEGFGEHQVYGGVNGIYIDGGDDKDDIRADATVTVPITLLGGDGDDKLDGGSGPDSISGGDGTDWIYGYDGADILNGDDGNDVVFGGKGNDTSISGGDGDDQLYGEEGNDTMYGGDGNDIMYGDAQPNSAGDSSGTGNDVMDGDDGDDVMNGAGGNDDMDGGDGADFIEGIDGNDTVHGGAGNDVINGDLGNDVLYGGDDDDVIRGYNDDTPQAAGADDDQIFGDEGFDDLKGNNGNDFIVGGTQSDAILGGTGDDTILSGWGDDVVHGEDGKDYIEGGPDNDSICGQGQTDTIWGGTTMYGFSYIVLGYVDPFVDGGFSQTSCTSPIIFTPPTVVPGSDTGTISGQKYHDLNANGVHDPNEPGLDRWKITLYNGSGVAIASVLTTSIDLNEDGSIDPYSESGLYSFEALAPGNYKVGETLQAGWFQSEPTGPFDAAAGSNIYPVTVGGGDIYDDLDFGNYRKGTITGQKFQDSNGNGRQDGNEIYLNGWTIQLYDEDNHLIGTQVTHTQGAVGGIQLIGYYEFTNLTPGSYRVVEVLQPGWTQTGTPDGPIEISSGEVSSGNDFGNRPDGGHIGGTKWEDLNGDGKRQENEHGMAGVTIYIDTNNNGQLDPGEPFTVTSGDNPEFPGDETGSWSFENLGPGSYTIREVPPAGYAQTFPNNSGGAWIVTLTADGMVFENANFGNAPRPSSICGVKFLDKNKNGKRDQGEPLLPGWVIYLDLNHNGVRDPGEPVTTTSTDGHYCFNNLGPGTYDVYETPQSGWRQTAPAPAPGKEYNYYTVTLSGGMAPDNIDFGNVPEKFQGDNRPNHITITRGPNGTLDVYDNDKPGQVPVFSHPLNLMEEEGIFYFFMHGGNDQIILDFRNGNPVPPGKVNIDLGTGNDSVKVLLPAVQSNLLVFDDTDGKESIQVNGILIGMNQINQMEVIGGNADDTLVINHPLGFSPIFRGGAGQNQLILNDTHYEFPAEFLTDGVNLNVEVHNDSELFFTGDQSLNRLIAHEAAHVVQQRAGVALRLNQLDIGPNATVDLGESDLILQATTATRQAMYNYLFGQIARARNTGQTPLTRWLGHGLTSNAAHLNPKGVTTLGVFQRNESNLEFLRRFPLDDNSLIVRFTYVGDLNGDGRQNADDYARMDAGYATHATGFGNGDVNYSGGSPNADDYFGADNSFANQGAPINPPAPSKPSVTPAASGDIRGNKFWDANGDGVRQTTEVGISGVTIFLDNNNNGVFEPALGEVSTTTVNDDPATPAVNEAGNYSFVGLAFGTFVVREIVPAGFVPTTPVAFSVTLTAANPIASNVNFGNRPANGGSGEIHGNKFSDNNGSGKREAGESGLAGVVIYLDRDNSGTLTSGDISTVTQNDNPSTPTIDETGNYDFFNLPSGTYIVREVVPAGYTQTAPSPNPFYVVDIGQGTVVSGRDFGNRPSSGAIRGDKFRDLDGDGIHDPNEPGIGGVTIYIDVNGNGQPDAGEPTTITAADGSWSFTDVPFGTYKIAEVVPAGYAQTAPAGNGAFTITFGGQSTFLEFGNRRGEITGTKFRDDDGDGKRGANEPALAGVTIYLDLNRNAHLDTNEPSMQTMEDNPQTPEIETGRYFFQDLPAGVYVVREIIPAGYNPTVPVGGNETITISAGRTETVNFGNKPDVGISGTKWDDLNGDGRRVQGEPGLAGVTIYIDVNGNHQLDAGEPWTVTGADGSYSFHNLNPGVYTVCEVVPEAYGQTFPTSNNGCHVVQVGQGVVGGRDFGNSNRPGSIHGTKFNDLNANRKWDAGEPGLAGVKVYVDLNGNGVFDAGEPSATTLTDNPGTPANEAGVYWIYDVPPGNWPVREVVPAGFAQSYPGVALIGSDPSGTLYDVSTTSGATSNPRATAVNLVGISKNSLFTGIHGLTTSGQLLSINEASGASVLIGMVAAAVNEGDLEFDPATGELYGLYGSGSTLYRINAATGAPTLVGALATGDPSAMAFDADGNLFVFDGAAMKIAKINKATGGLIGPAVSIGGPNLGAISGMDFDPLTGTLYLATGGNIGGPVPMLYTLNPTTGALSSIGPTSAHVLSGLTFVERDYQTVTVTPGSTTNGVNFGNYQAVILPDGDDSISGGDAADTIHGDNGSGFPAPIITIGGDDSIWGDADADQIWGQDENDLLYGGDSNDLLYGNEGNDTMDGNAGNDTASGGEGDDTYVFTTPATATIDVVNELFAEGSDWIDMTDVVNAVVFDLNVSSAARSTNLTINLQDGFGADGSMYMENILGSVTKTNTLIGNAADNILFGGNQSDIITGNLGNNYLFGSDGDDTFIPSAGIDVIVSGDVGYDRLDYSAFPVAATVNLQTHSGTHVTLFTDIELFIGSAFSDTLIGPNTGPDWHITSANAGDVDGAGVADFQSFENLTGGSGFDVFMFSDGASVSGMIDGDGGPDALDYSAYTTSVTVDLTAGTATGTGGIVNIEHAIGGSAADILTGDAGANILLGRGGDDTITGNDGPDTMAGEDGSDSVTGGNGNDVYLMNSAIGTDTLVEAVGGGNDTLNYATFTGPITIDLQAGTATGTTAGSVANIETFVGTSAADTLIGQDIANTWNITGLNSGNINGTIFFSGFEKLAGGLLADIFKLAGGSISVSVDGRGGPDTLDYSAFGGPVTVNLASHVAPLVGTFANMENLIGTASNDTLIGDNAINTWNITNNNAGNINGAGVLDFTSFENLTGGNSADTFVFADGKSVAGIIDGDGGADTFDYSAYTSAVTVNLQAQTATGTGGFASIERFVGGSVSDTLAGRNIANIWHITALNGGDINGAGNLDFAGFENLAGGSSTDNFVFSNGMGVSGNINGSGGIDAFDYSPYTTGVSVDLSAGTATGVGSFSSVEQFLGTGVADSLTGANAANVWTINGPGSGDINGAIAFTSFENLTGGVLSDSFRVATGGSIPGSVIGAGGTNTLDYSLRAAPATVNLQTSVATDVASFFSNIQAFVGSSGSDTMIGRNVVNNWNLTTSNGGDVNGVAFGGFENLTGGSSTDNFIFSAGVLISGAINGSGATTDLISYAGYVTAVLVNLPLNAATGTGSIQNVEHITGGSGDDILIGLGGISTIKGGLGNDVLVGNGGNDSLEGSDGRDILIGGSGVDGLNGGLGEDILIGGSTSWDANVANLLNIQARWAGAGLFNARVTDLQTNPPQFALATIISDGVNDVLTGGGDLDWFITNVGDNLTDFNTPAGEVNDVF